MIIEDEPLIAMDIEQMVESLGHAVTGIARTHKEAMALFEQAEAGNGSGRYPARGRQLRASMRSTTSWPRSRFR